MTEETNEAPLAVIVASEGEEPGSIKFGMRISEHVENQLDFFLAVARLALGNAASARERERITDRIVKPTMGLPPDIANAIRLPGRGLRGSDD